MCDSDLTKWEQDAISTVEQNYEESANFAQVDSEGCRLRLESRFKEVALAITQLYTSYSHALGSPQHRQDAYNAFRAAACKLTDFYNESKECHSVIRERSRRYGQSSKDRDLAKWAKARRRMVRREDIFSTLIGKPPPSRPTSSFSKSLSHSQLANEAINRSRNSPQRRSPRPSTSTAAASKSQRRNSLLNKDLSHLQETMDDFSMGSPPRETLASSRKRAFQMFDEAVNDRKRPRTEYDEFYGEDHY